MCSTSSHSPPTATTLAVLCAALLFAASAAASAPQPDTTSANPGWLGGVQESIRDSEYHVTWQTAEKLPDVEAAWQAPNRAHGLRTYFTDEGIRVIPRTESPPSWEWGLSLVGYGRGRQVWPVLRVTPAADRNRVDYFRGDVAEWYVNDSRGLEQGFTLPGRPQRTGAAPRFAGRTDDGAVLLVLQMRGNLRPVLSADGRAIDLVGVSSALNVAHFGGLVVRDAAGRELPAWMEIVPGSGAQTLYVLFDDRDAAYPVTVDPLLQAEAWSAEGNQTGAEFGVAVAGAGDVNGDGYDDVVVGAQNFDAGESDEGRVFVYHGSPSGVEPYPDWTAESNEQNARFGRSVGAGNFNGDGLCDGGDNAGNRCQDNADCAAGGGVCFDTLCYGGSDEGNACPPSSCPGGVCKRHPRIPLGDVIVGAPGAGDYYVYNGSVSGLPSQYSAYRNWNSNFGFSVSTAGDVNGDGYDDAIIGAPDEGDGVARVYLGSSSGLPGEGSPAWTKGGWQNDCDLGYSVSTAGDVNNDGYDDVIIGIPKLAEGIGDNEEGAVYIYHGNSTSVDPGNSWNFECQEDLGYCGYSVSTAGDVNNDGYDDVIFSGHCRGASCTGQVWVYLGSFDGVQSSGAWSRLGYNNNDVFGSSVSTAGDVNDDGFDDIIVGARALDVPGINNAGGAYVYLGATAGVSSDPAWIVRGESAGDLGSAVADAGDVNGDGYADVIVGAPVHDGDKTDEGRAIVYHGAEDVNAHDLALHALETEWMVCVGGADDGNLCDEDTDCDGGTCSGTPALSDTGGVFVWADGSTAPPEPTSDTNNDSSSAVYYGPVPHSVVVSTGLAQDEGRGDMDWGDDGHPDLVRWQFNLQPPTDAATLRFTTQFITSDIESGKSRDSVTLYFWRSTAEHIESVNLAGVAGLGVQEVNSPVSHGIRVDDINDPIKLVFEVKDGTNGSKDSALVISNLYFSKIPLPEGANTDTSTPAVPEYLSNPSPQDTGTIAGTYSYRKTLYSVPGNGMPFELSIRYNSASTLESKSLGPKWAHSYDATLQKAKVQEDPNGDEAPDWVDLVVVHLGNGLSEYFRCAKTEAPPYTCTTADPYAPKYAGVYSTLTQTATASYEYETKDHVKYVFNVDLDHPDGATTDPYEKYALKEITDTNGNVITLNYDTDDRLDFVLDTRGEVFTFNYDSDDRLVSVENPQGGGGGVTFQHDGYVIDGELTKLPTSYTDLNGHVTSFTYDRKGNILTCTDDDGTTFVSNDYEQHQAGAGQQIGDRAVVRRNANPGDPGMHYTFTGETVRNDDRVAGVEVTRYDVKAREYDRSVFLGTNDTGMGCDEAVASCWAVSSSLYEKVCVGGDHMGEGCDTDTDCPDITAGPDAFSSCGSTSNPVERIDPLGAPTRMTYDESGNMTSRTEAAGLCVGGPDQGNACATDANCTDSTCGILTEMAYDDRHNLLARAVAPTSLSDCGTWPNYIAPCYVYEYDTGPTPTDNVLSETNELGFPISYTYTAKGLKETEEDRRGNVSDFEYEPRGYLTKETGPAPDLGDPRPVAEHAYDEFGRRIWTKDPNDHESWFVYDTGGRMLSETNARDEATSYTHDEWDRMLSRTYPDGALETYDYTPTGRLERAARPLGAVVGGGECIGGSSDGAVCDDDGDCPDGRCGVGTKYVYDAEDRLVKEIDELGRETSYTCDAGDRLVGVTDPATEYWSARYDPAGNMLGFKHDFDPVETTFAYDPLGRVTQETDAEGNTVETAYDERGSISQITRADGEDTVSYAYDDAGQLTAITLSGGRAISHSLDPNGNRETTTDTDFTGDIGRTFDAYDRLKTRTDPFGNTIEYDYDSAGNLTSLQYSDGKTVTYTYDELNRLETVTDWNLNQTTYTYDAVGNLASVELPGTSGTYTYTYDAGHRLTTILGPFYQGTFTRDAAGTVTTAVETLPLDPVFTDSEVTLTYDLANRLTFRGADSFGHDPDGNMISATIGGSAPTMVYDELNQLVQVDADTYGYDADGLRVEVVRGGVTRRYVFDMTGERPRLLEEQDDVGTVLARYVHGVGLIGREDAATGNDRFYHYDVRGSTVALTDDTGAIKDRYAYTPYGAVTRDGSNTTDNPFTYNGRDGVFDDDNGLYFMRTRYYAPELMRFIQKDRRFSGTLDDPQSLNRYAYVKGDPIRFVDPDGESGWGWLSIALGVAAIVVTVSVAVAAAAAAAAAAVTGAITVAAVLAELGVGSAIALALSVFGVAAGGLDLHESAEDTKQQERRINELETQLNEWSLDDLRDQIDEADANILTRGLSVPYPVEAVTGASDEPTPCR